MKNIIFILQYSAIVLGATIGLIEQSYWGLIIILAAVAGIVLCKDLMTLLLSFFTFSLGIAFDYYLRNDGPLLFYRQDGLTVATLAAATYIFYCALLHIDFSSKRNSSVLYADYSSKKIQINKAFFVPALVAVIWCILFLLQNAGNIFSKSFSLETLGKFSFLEYYAIIIYFLFSSASGFKSKIPYYSAVITTAILISVVVVSSYRMVAIVLCIATLFSTLKENKIKKVYLISIWLFGLIVFGVIARLRQGDYSFGFSEVFGYKDDLLDNNFTGVIETSLIYTTSSLMQSFEENLLYLIAVLAPLPNSFIPDKLLYYIEIRDIHTGRIPGGGILPGFILYFNLILAPIYYYMYKVSITMKTTSMLPSILYFILLTTVSRWWLYGPYVVFNFLGFFLAIYSPILIIRALGFSKKRKP